MTTRQQHIAAINAEFPIAGEDNNSQGFRDNFSNIKSALSLGGGGGGGTPGGDNTQIQFNNDGTFGGSSNLAFNVSTNKLLVGIGLEAGAGVVTGTPLWAWGSNREGQLGLGTSSNYYSEPTQIGMLNDWLQVAGGYYHTSALKTNHTLWTWGGNWAGQLGIGTSGGYSTYVSSPTQVGALTNWSILTGMHYFVVAVKTDRSLWAWGHNTNGQLGIGNTIDYSSPVQVGSLTDWLTVSSGYHHTVALKTNGTLWAWGRNDFGQLGIGNTISYSSPVQVGSLTDWIKISCGAYFTLATKSNGTLWAWGANQDGQLGVGTLTNYSSPVQIGVLTTWATPSAGFWYAHAIKTDGTLWSWGSNWTGQLGIGTSSNYYSSPVQVGSLTTWDTVSGNYSHSVARHFDGTIWGWARDHKGQLGQGIDFSTQLTPIQIGIASDWLSITAGYNNTFAIKDVSVFTYADIGTESEPFGNLYSNNIHLTRFNETVVTNTSVGGSSSSYVTIVPDVIQGSIFNYTLIGNIELNGLMNAVPGTSVTIILTQDSTGSRLLSSTMKFAGGVNALSTAAGAVDVLSIFYSGTAYYTTLTKGYV